MNFYDEAIATFHDMHPEYDTANGGTHLLHDKVLNALKRAKKEHELIEALKFQLHIERLWNIQLEQSFDEMKQELMIHDQANMLFDFISENYEQLDSIVARLQKHYNSDAEEYEQQEEDRIILYNLLELHDDLSKCGGMNKERRKINDKTR
jgi:hypothetical protein